MRHKALNHILCAALVDKRFCRELLIDTAKVIHDGYLDHTFDLPVEDYRFVCGIRTTRVEDFAEQIIAQISR
jgi:hypothetical protein